MFEKEEIRIIGVDDGYFVKGKSKRTILVGAIMRGYKQLDGVLSTRITVDGWDVSENLVRMIKRSSHYKQLRVIMLNGITFAGFNTIDCEHVYKELGLPIIIVIRKKPDLSEFRKAMLNLRDGEERWKLVKKLEEPKPVVTRHGTTYYQKYGISDEDAKALIQKTAVYSRIPEPVRVAHLIAMGVTLGYSKGKP